MVSQWPRSPRQATGVANKYNGNCNIHPEETGLGFFRFNSKGPYRAWNWISWILSWYSSITEVYGAVLIYNIPRTYLTEAKRLGQLYWVSNVVGQLDLPHLMLRPPPPSKAISKQSHLQANWAHRSWKCSALWAISLTNKIKPALNETFILFVIGILMLTLPILKKWILTIQPMSTLKDS